MAKLLYFSLALGLAVIPLRSAAAQAPRVDHHQHLFGAPIVELVMGPQALASGTAKPITARDLVALLDSAGIQRAVVLSVAYMYGNPNRPAVENEYERVRAENDWTSQQVAQFPDRLVAFCSTNPLKDYALDEIARCARDPQLRRGLKLHFGNSDVDLHNPQHADQLRRVFRAANDNRMPIVVHMRASVTRERPHGRAEALLFLSELLPAAPDVPVQVAHLTGSGRYDEPTDQALAAFAEAIANHDARTAHLYFDVSAVVRPATTATDLELIARRLRQIGLDRLLFGSDGAVPGNSPREAWAVFRRLPLSDAEFGTIAGNVAPYLR